MKVLAVIAVVLIVVITMMLVIGNHGPGRHVSVRALVAALQAEYVSPHDR